MYYDNCVNGVRAVDEMGGGDIYYTLLDLTFDGPNFRQTNLSDCQFSTIKSRDFRQFSILKFIDFYQFSSFQSEYLQKRYLGQSYMKLYQLENNLFYTILYYIFDIF